MENKMETIIIYRGYFRKMENKMKNQYLGCRV